MVGAWNIETAREFKLELVNNVLPLLPKQWAALTVMSDWELCTPDCEPVIVEFSLEAKKHGLTREAVVNNKEATKLELFEKYQNKQLVKQANPEFERGFFKDEDQALVWLQAQGFTTDLS